MNSIHDQPERPDFVPEHLPWPVPKDMTKQQMRDLGYPWRIWHTPRKPRSNRLERNATRARTDPAKNLFIRLQQTEEGRKLWKLWTDKRHASKLGRPRGATEGYLKSERDKFKVKAKAEAKVLVEFMENTKGFEIPKQEFAKEAIVTAVEIMRREDIHPKDKLSAAKTVLEWTLSKPATEANVNVKTAESFLEDIAREMNQEKK